MYIIRLFKWSISLCRLLLISRKVQIGKLKAERKITGTLHTAGVTRVSRHEFALKLAEAFNLNTDLIKPAKMDEMPWRAKRPEDPSLNVSKVSALLNAKLLKLNEALVVMSKEATHKQSNKSFK